MTPVEPPSTGRTRSRWLLPVVALLVVVAAGLAAAAEQVGDTTAPAGWQPVAVLVLLVVSSGLGLEYRAAGHGDRLDLFEVAVAVALVALPGGEAVLLVALAKTATLVLQGVPPAKTAFNVAQRACAAAAGALVLALLRAPGPTALTDLAPLVPALALTYAVNTAAVLLVLAVVRAPGLRSPRTGGALSAAVANAVVNLGLGVGAAALWLRDPAAWPVLPLAMVAAHVGTRAWVHREAATARLVGLHRAAAALAGPAGLDTDVPRFLVELRGSFRCGGAQLHLGAGDERSRRWSTDTEAPAPLVAALLADPSPRRLPDPAQPELTRLFEQTRWRDLLVVPVRRGSGVAGVLLVHDRAGWEGFVPGELAVLDAVAGVLGEAVQRDHLEQVVAAAEARWRTAVRQASDVVLVLDGRDRVLDANPACAAVLGQDESALLGTDLVEVVDPEDRAGLRRVLRDVRAGRALDGRTDFTTGTGARHVEAVVTRLDEPRADRLVLTARDITLRRRREQLVSELAAVLELVAGGGPLVQTLEALATALERQVPGARCGVVLGSGREAELLACGSLPEGARPQLAAVVATALRARPDLDQVVLRPVPGDESGSELAGAGLRMLQLRPFPPSQRAGALVLAHRGVVPAHAAALLEETVRVAVIAVRHAAVQQRLAHQAAHDPLTDLPNRVVFLDRLDRALRSSRREGRQVLVLFLDLDRFKVVNDSLGHRAGDALLRAVAERLRQAVRPGDTVARFGGDEFTMLCESIVDEAHALAVVERVRESLSRPFPLGDNEIFATTSIGMALGTGSGPAEVLVEQADAAMYRAKERGGNRFEAFDAQMRDRSLHRLDTQSALNRALERHEFRVHYQPTFSLETGRLVGLEALVRWDRPGRGLLPPAEFVDLAEDSGLIVALGEQVLETALAQAARWQALARRQGTPQPYVGINLSARQLVDPGLADLLAGALRRSGADPTGITLELTETALIQDMVLSGSQLDDLKALGVQLFVDDFGTGYSSLTYLQRLPVDGVKVDRSFVAGLGEQDDAEAIVRAVVGLADSLGLQTVAEGVETAEHVRLLRALQCTAAQGFHLGRPVPAEEIRLDARVLSLP